MAANYIPTTDADLSNWALNFSQLITGSPTAYGLTAGDATAIAAVVNPFVAALSTATDPSTRTPSAIAAKDSAKTAMLAVVRAFAQNVNNNAAVTNDQRVDLGLTVRTTTRTPIPPPTAFPILALLSAVQGVMTLGYKSSDTPTSKAKPPGAIGMEVRVAIGTAAITDPTQAKATQTVTKSPWMLLFDSGDAGKTASIFGRFVNRSGVAGVSGFGPWSAPLSVTIV